MSETQVYYSFTSQRRFRSTSVTIGSRSLRLLAGETRQVGPVAPEAAWTADGPVDAEMAVFVDGQYVGTTVP